MMSKAIAGPVDEGVVAIVEAMNIEHGGDEEGVESDFADVEGSGLDAPMACSLPAQEVSSDDELGVDPDEEGSGDDDLLDE
jgi:hypothetical protein